MKKMESCAYLQISSVPEWERLCHRSWYLLRTEGISSVVGNVVRKFLGQPKAKAASAKAMDGALGLEAGDVVEVRSREEIKATLDAADRTNGLLFMEEMWKYCGRRFTVYKKVKTILVESTGKQRHPKHTVLLDGVHCDGSMHSNCDSSCFHFWREAWLKKVPEPEVTTDESVGSRP